jgi:hypothetical protein
VKALRKTLPPAFCIAASLIATSSARADWAAPVTLGLPSFHQLLTSVSALNGGRFALAWDVQPPIGSHDDSLIQARLVDAQGTVGPLLTLADTFETIDDPTVAAVPGGSGGIATWYRQHHQYDISLEQRAIAADGTLGAVRTVTDPGDGAIGVAVAPAPDGDAVVAWIDQVEQAQTGLKVRLVSADGTIGPSTTIEDPHQGQTKEVSSTRDAATGETVLLWNQHGVLRTQRIAADGTPIGSPLDLGVTGETAVNSRVALDSTGTTRVTWGQQGISTAKVLQRTISPAGVAGPVRVLSNVAEDAVNVQSAVMPSGEGAVVWQVNGYAPGQVILRGRTVAADGSLGPVLDLSQPIDVPPGAFPSLTVDGAGRYTVVWQQSDATDSSIDVLSTSFSTSGRTPIVTLGGAGSDEVPTPKVAAQADGTAMATFSLSQPGVDGVFPTAARFTLAPTPAPTPTPTATTTDPTPPPAPVSESPSASTAPAAPLAAFARLSLVGDRAAVDAHGRVTLRLRCTVQLADGCPGSLRVRLRGARSSAGRGGVNVAGGTTARVRLTLARSMRARLSRGHRVSVLVELRTVQPGGAAPVQTSYTALALRG